MRYDLALPAYVFMPEHVHLVIYPNRSQYDISAILSSSKVPVANRALARMRKVSDARLEALRVGDQLRFWQPGGGYDRNIYSTEALQASIDYIHQNPFHRGLVDHTANDQWSGAGAFYSGSSELLRVDTQLAL
jgi:putative transposase